MGERDRRDTGERRAVIFDLDGVLIDSYEAHLRSWQELARENGLTLTGERFAPHFGRSGRDVIRSLWPAAVARRRLDELERRKRELYRRSLADGPPVMDGAVDLIDALRAAGFRLAVASSGTAEAIDLVLRRLRREDAFAARVSGEDVEAAKPDPAIFLEAAGRLGVEAARCAVIEDAPAGIAAARAAGMAVIGLVSGPFRAGDLRAADRVVESLRELHPDAVDALIAARSPGRRPRREERP